MMGHPNISGNDAPFDEFIEIINDYEHESMTGSAILQVKGSLRRNISFWHDDRCARIYFIVHFFFKYLAGRQLHPQVVFRLVLSRNYNLSSSFRDNSLRERSQKQYVFFALSKI